MIWCRAWIAMLAACLVVASASYACSAGATDAPELGGLPLLKAEAAKLGTPRLDGVEKLTRKDSRARQLPAAHTEVPVLYFGSTRINGDHTLADEVVRQSGIATLGVTIYARHGDNLVLVASNSGAYERSEMRVLLADPRPLSAIFSNESFYGTTTFTRVQYMGNTFSASFEPIHDAAGNVIGAYCVYIFVGIAF